MTSLVANHLPRALTPLVLAALALLTAASAGNPYCDSAWFWSPDFSRKQGTADWSSYGRDASFGRGPCVMVSGIGVTVTYQSTVIIVDRNGATNTYAKLPNGQLAYGQEIVLGPATQRPLDVLTNTFCSTGAHLPDGTLLSIGGDWSPGGYLGNGIDSVRAITPCRDATCQFSIRGKLQRGRWYPTSILLPSGRIMVVGGSTGGVGLNTPAASVPSIEYFPANGQGVFDLQLLKDTLPYNLYPFLHLLPSGNVFVFAGSKWCIWSTTTNSVVPGNRPSLDRKGPNGQQIFRSYPLTGTSALLPLAPGSPAEVMICGGATTAAYNASGQDAWAVADNMCYLIKPEDTNPTWVGTAMKAPRVMPNAVLLPDGHVLIVNGAQTGWAGLGNVGHRANLFPEMYNAYTKQWYQGPLPPSTVPRSYHSSAVLLADASVFISGSNPHSNIVINGNDFPTEFRTEYFFPPFAKYGTPRPVVTGSPATVNIQTPFSVSFTHNSKDKVSVVLAHPGFSTHSNNHGMRNVLLNGKGVQGGGGKYTVTVDGCPSKNICPPTWYWLFVVVNGIPNGNSVVVFVK